MGLVQVTREYRRPQAVDVVIGAIHRFLDILYAEDGQRRTEALVLREHGIVRNILDESGKQEITLFVLGAFWSLATGEHSSAALHRVSNLVFHFLALALGMQGAKARFLVESVADGELLDFINKAVHN